MSSNSFFKSSIFYGIGVFGSKAIVFALVPISSFFLSVEALGVYDIVLVTIMLLTPIVTLQLSDGAYRYLLRSETEESYKISIISTAALGIFMNFMFFLFLIWLLSFVTSFKYFPELTFLLLSSCYYVFCQQVLRGLKLQRAYALIGILNAILILVTALLFLLMGLGLQGVLLAIAIGQSITISYSFFKQKLSNYIKFEKFNLNILKSLLRYSWPLLPNALSWWLIDLGNRYIILFFLSAQANGIYAVAARYAAVVALFNSIFVLSWQDRIISKNLSRAEVKTYASKVLEKFLKFEITLIAFLTAIAEILIKYTTDEAFNSASKFYPLLLVSLSISSLCAFFGAFYLQIQDTKQAFLTTFIGGIINVVISLFLIQYIGLYAVCVGSISGFLITLLLRQKRFQLTFKKKTTLNLILYHSGIFYLAYSNNVYFTYSIIAISFLVFIFVNRPLFSKILDFITK